MQSVLVPLPAQHNNLVPTLSSQLLEPVATPCAPCHAHASQSFAKNSKCVSRNVAWLNRFPRSLSAMLCRLCSWRSINQRWQSVSRNLDKKWTWYVASGTMSTLAFPALCTAVRLYIHFCSFNVVALQFPVWFRVHFQFQKAHCRNTQQLARRLTIQYPPVSLLPPFAVLHLILGVCKKKRPYV
jgi:hypothetical protein